MRGRRDARSCCTAACWSAKPASTNARTRKWKRRSPPRLTMRWHSRSGARSPRVRSWTGTCLPDHFPMTERQLRFAEAIHEAIDICLDRDRTTYVMGLGVPDPIGVFGTTKGLQQKHGSRRVFDMPVAENGMTGIALGSCLVGMRPVMTHMRLEF